LKRKPQDQKSKIEGIHREIQKNIQENSPNEKKALKINI